MKVHVLGCGDAFGSGGRNHSGYLVEATDKLFLLDCGPTSLLAMKRLGFDPARLNAILLTHLHGDHFGGLPFFFIEFLHQTERKEPLHVAGPPNTENRVRQIFDVMYGNGESSRELPPTVFHTLAPGKAVSVHGIDVFSFRVPHQVQEISLGLKVTYQGKQILFSGDSAWTDQFLIHAHGCDLFLCECSFYDQDSSNHMNYRQLRSRLSDSNCKKIVLVHMGDVMLSHARESVYTTAEDGMTMEV
jgi:ribonuclease BN (tRNA processing enzyme)